MSGGLLHTLVKFLASSTDEEDNQKNIESEENDANDADDEDDEERNFFSRLVGHWRHS